MEYVIAGAMAIATIDTGDNIPKVQDVNCQGLE